MNLYGTEVVSDENIMFIVYSWTWFQEIGTNRLHTLALLCTNQRIDEIHFSVDPYFNLGLAIILKFCFFGDDHYFLSI